MISAETATVHTRWCVHGMHLQSKM